MAFTFLSSKTSLSCARALCGIALCAVLTLGVTACASSKGTQHDSAAIADPIEPVNRAIFSFNNVVDIIVIEPLGHVYMTFVPDFLRDGIRNFMRNLRSPLIVANNLLQGDIYGAGVATKRFLINTTVGIGGLFDAAQSYGMYYSPEDFGQTLAVWGLGDGFYVVLPIIGPTTLRDGTGLLVDGVADPVRLWAFSTKHDSWYYTRVLVEGFDYRARLAKGLQDLRRNSFDYYATIRSAYAQKRLNQIRDTGGEGNYTDIPDYNDYDD